MSSKARLGQVRDAHKFDESALETFLNANVPGASGSLDVQQFDAGQSNPTFLVTLGDDRYVVRKKPPGQLLPKAHMVEREYRIMKALRDSDVPVPQMLAFCDDADVIGTPFFVMEYLPGRVFWDATFPNQTPKDRSALFAEMTRVLSALHRVDYDGAGLSDYGRAGNYFSRQISRWSRQYKAAETETIEAMDKLIEWLPAHVPDDDATTIVHGDYRLDNLIFHPTEPRIIAVVDWELSTLGNPLADLAYFCMSYVIDTPYHASLGGIAGPDSGIPTMEETIAEYCRHTQRDGIPEWEFCLAFSLFRSASILQGVYKRGLMGTASSTSAVALGKLAKVAGKAAWDLVR